MACSQGLIAASYAYASAIGGSVETCALLADYLCIVRQDAHPLRLTAVIPRR